jgi:two-component system sensor histidine kinase TctE
MSGTSSLRHQLLVRLVVILVILSAVGAWVAYLTALYFGKAAYDRALFNSALALAGQVQNEQGATRVDLPQAALRMLEADEYDKVYYLVSRHDGEFIAGYKDLPQPVLPQSAPGKAYYFDATYKSDPIRIAAMYVLPVGKPGARPVRIEVAETLLKRNLLANEILFGAILPQLLLIVFAWIAVRYTVIRGLAPLQALRQQIGDRSHRDLSPIAAEQIPLEVQPLLHAINDLLSRLSDVVAAQERFIAAAAHQLRTPIAGLKTQTELALRQTDPSEIRRILQQLLNGAERMSHLVNQLLSLARAEPLRGPHAGIFRIDLNRLARETTAQWVPPALSRNIDIGFQECPDAAVLQGNTALLTEMLGNLLDNAVRYTPSGGTVTVQVARDGDKLLLSVEDNGPGIPDEDRGHVFEPFYRILGTDTDGCGLGLSIVREIVANHDAEIKLENGQNGAGTKITVAFTAS